jgi:STE24 endopeptidase
MKIALISLIALAYFIDVFFYFLRMHQRNKQLSKELLDIYDLNTYNRWKSNISIVLKHQMIQKTVVFIILMILLMLNLVSYLFNILSNIGFGTILINPLIAVILVFIYNINGLISRLIIVFHPKISPKLYNLNVKTFIIDWFIKTIRILCHTFFLVFLFGKGFNGEGYVNINNQIAVISAYLAILFEMIHTRRFFKLKPFKESNLKNKIIQFANSHQFNTEKIKVMSMSNRSNQANAYAQGYGKFKNIVLLDTLINNFKEEEIVALFAHEVGHFKNKDISKIHLMQIPLLVITLISFLLLLNIEYSSLQFGSSQISVIIALIASIHIYKILKIIFNALTHFWITKIEFDADNFAASNYNKDYLISALKKIAIVNMIDVNPHSIDYLFNHRHPAFLDRITRLNRMS